MFGDTNRAAPTAASSARGSTQMGDFALAGRKTVCAQTNAAYSQAAPARKPRRPDPRHSPSRRAASSEEPVPACVRMCPDGRSGCRRLKCGRCHYEDDRRQRRRPEAEPICASPSSHTPAAWASAIRARRRGEGRSGPAPPRSPTPGRRRAAGRDEALRDTRREPGDQLALAAREVGTTAVADQDQRAPARRSRDEGHAQIGVESTRGEHLAMSQAPFRLARGRAVERPHPPTSTCE